MRQRTHTLAITGMTCEGCSGRVANVLNATAGVLQVTVSHESNSGTVTTDERISTEDLLAIVAATGFGVSA